MKDRNVTNDASKAVKVKRKQGDKSGDLKLISIDCKGKLLKEAKRRK